MTARLRERAVVFGPGGNLKGIFTYPPSQRDSHPRLAFVILNSGVIHRVGSNRISVRLARAVAELGIPVLRFDQSGLGDSEPRSDTDDLEESVERDIDEAMEYLAVKMKIDRFVFAGLCSGAARSLQTAWRDPRVVGMFLMDPPIYGTPRSLASHYVRRAMSLRSWWNAISGRNHYGEAMLKSLSTRKKKASRWPDRLPDWPSRRIMGEALETLTDRGTKLSLIYTGAFETYNYTDQLKDAFPEACASENLCWSFMPDASHTFSREENRKALLSSVKTWLNETGLAPRIPSLPGRRENPDHSEHSDDPGVRIPTE